ncbi:hypothetical protein SASPL_156462 [Salvia splendens]|uniref:COBRA C-terminal domain-containing protein n=1 Tax=Salvia splendens TaxID=180675 RepID=A0A8X8VWT7_SALSN|nr:hypothetical protein SASPL_156462 [Salvia splendens]
MTKIKLSTGAGDDVQLPNVSTLHEPLVDYDVGSKKEVIWSMVGAQTTEQGDCSKFKGNVPHCCKRVPTVVDLLPGVSVGLSGTTNKTVKLPTNFTLLGPGPGYTCGPAKIVPSTVYLTPDRRRKTQALMTWNVTCTYSQLLVSRHPSCCVSLSPDSNKLKMLGINTPKKDNTPLTAVHAPHVPDTSPLAREVLQRPADGDRESGNVQTEILLKKDKDEFTFKQGRAFPRKIYFNGDECMLPPPDAYPILPNSAYKILTPFSRFAAFLIFVIAVSHFL